MQKNKNFPWVATPLAIAISSFAAGNALASATTDTSFGVNGIASLNFDYVGVRYPVNGDIEYYYREPVKIQPRQPMIELGNGDIVSFASRYEEVGTAHGSSYWISPTIFYKSYGDLIAGISKTRMSRFTASGAPVSTVDIDGILAVSALKQPDGKLLLMGNDLVRGAGQWSYRDTYPPSTITITPKPTLTSQIVLRRFNADGTADSTFDGDGILQLGLPGARQAMGMALMPDEKIVVLSADFNSTSSDPQLWRFNPDGSVDTSFGGGDGNLPLPISNAWGMLEQQDNKLLVHYNDSSNHGYARFNVDGSLDTSFAGDGTLNIAESFYAHPPMLQQANGKLLLAGWSVVKRYNLNGSYELSFPSLDIVLSLAETSAGDVLIAYRDISQNSLVGVFNSNAVKNTTVYLDENISSPSAPCGYSCHGEILIQSNGGLLASGMGAPVTTTAALNRHINYALPGGDLDSDAVADPVDNCPNTANNNQINTDGDTQGDACDSDDDNDGVADIYDLFPTNPLQAGDYDSDSIESLVDNCPNVANTSQLNTDGDTQGDACDSDDDNDGVADVSDNCPLISNANQLDSDADHVGDACDSTPFAFQAGSLDMGFNPGSGANSRIYTTSVQVDGKIIVSGTFTSMNGAARNYIARLNADGSLDTSFNPGSGANNSLFTHAIQANGKIVIGGDFTSYNGIARNRIARLNSDGSLDTSFNPGSGVNYSVRAAVVQGDGKIIIGGGFTSYNGTARNRIARLNTNGSIDTGFNVGTGVDNAIMTTVLQGDGKIVIGGSFILVNGDTRNRIARLNTDGSLDISFNPGSGANNYVLTSAVQADGKILIGGNFTVVQGVARNGIARLNSDGSLDASFNPGTGVNSFRWLYSIAVQADGKILIGGDFTSFNGVARSSIARLNADASLDLDFNPGSGLGDAIFNSVDSIAVQADGHTVIGGGFQSYNYFTRNRIARIHTGDTDSDGIEDAADQFPNDTDNDGLTNDIDTDDDNDGMPDTWETTYGLNPLLNDANGDLDGDGFSNKTEFDNGTDPTVVNVAFKVKNDYNNDGLAGWIWLGDSNGHETESQNWQLTFPLYSQNWGVPNRFYHPVFPDQANWDVVTTGDFNKDGDADILWRNNATAQWKVWQMQNGLRTAQNDLADFDLAHEWQVIGAGDTDKDGDDDVILNNTTTGEVLVWQMQNHGLVNSHNFGSASPYRVNRIGDFDKDGDVDLLFREAGGDTLATWEIQNNAYVAAHALANTGTNYNPVCAGDFDKDGDDDIMLVNSATTQEKWFVMENFTRTQKVGSTNTGFVFKGCGDYDGDGDADVLWQRSSDDANRVILQQNYGSTKQTVYTNAFGGANGFVYRGNSN